MGGTLLLETAVGNARGEIQRNAGCGMIEDRQIFYFGQELGLNPLESGNTYD